MRISTIKILLLLVLVISACETEVVNVYEVNRVELNGSASEKKNLKNDEQFIAILYRDLFNKNIDTESMDVLLETYSSFGDKPLIIDQIIKSMLGLPGIQVMTDSQMRADPKAFVNQLFEQFLVRKPTAQEQWFLENQIQQNPGLKAMDIYYAILTSEEYRYY